MNKGLVSFLASISVITGGTVGLAVLSNPPVQAQENDEQTNIRIYRLASPAVVSVKSGRGAGSGSVISSKGLVLTSAHVVRGATTVTVTLPNKQNLQGKVIASSRNPDLALIQLQGVTTDLPFINVGSSNQIQVGQRAFAIGDPFGRFAGTLTTGIISRIDTERKLIQTDAAINPGNSGGPLLNSRGELIGVNTSIFTTGREGNIGLGFAITADTVREFVAAAQQGRISNTNTAPPATTIALNGSVITGVLTNKDETLSDGSLFKTFQFAGNAGQRITIDMRSDDVDSYLVLFDPSGDKLAEDDDTGGGKNARIAVTLPTNGTYTLYANSYEVGEAGRFTLKAGVINPRSTVATAPTSRSQPNVLLQRNGILGAGSNVLARDGSLFETFSFAGRAGQLVQITLSSGEFHPYLVLFSPDRRVIKEDNGLPDRNNADITIQLPFTGTYRIVANAFDKTGRGAYSLTVRSLR